MRRTGLVILTVIATAFAASGCIGDPDHCESIAPSELPSGADPGAATEGVGGGTKSLTWGTGRDVVELRLGLSYYAPGLPLIAQTTVRGEPAIVYQVTSGGPLLPGEPLNVDWGEECQYSMILSPELSHEEVIDYAGRF